MLNKFFIAAWTTFTLVFGAVNTNAGMQGATANKADCGFDFFPHEVNQLMRYGWHCDKDNTEVAKRMRVRGFIPSQYVEAFRAAHDIPRTTPKDVETVAVLQLVDIEPKYYYMIDESVRPPLTSYYNRKLLRRGRILTIVGYSTAAVGIALSIVGGLMFAHAEDPALQMNPGATVIAAFGAASLFTGMSMGSLGVHKLRLVSYDNILDTGSMEELRKRRTKTHHFAPDDLFEYQMQAPQKPIIRTGAVSPVVAPGFVGVAGVIVF